MSTPDKIYMWELERRNMIGSGERQYEGDVVYLNFDKVVDIVLEAAYAGDPMRREDVELDLKKHFDL